MLKLYILVILVFNLNNANYKGYLSKLNYIKKNVILVIGSPSQTLLIL